MEQPVLSGNVEFKINKCDERILHHEYAVELIREYGKDSLAYLALEKDKQYFFGQKTRGFIAYVMVGKVVVCVGNPVCSDNKEIDLLKEFMEVCRENKHKISFCSISEDFAKLLVKVGFRVSKYGEEALLNLQSYEMVGSKTSKLRQKVKRAERCGIKVVEYNPRIKRDFRLEKGIEAVSEEWFANKNGRLSFTLGELNLDNPLDRRYFVALDENEEVQAILMFSPFNERKGYFLDVMRRKQNSAPGVMEKAIIDSSMIMKSEGVEYVSLGLAPLAGIQIKKSESTFAERVMHFAYNNMNSEYGFQTLHDYKKKFAPSVWKVRYIAFEPTLNVFKLGHAMVKARGVDGISKQILCGLLHGWKKFMSSRKNKDMASYTAGLNLMMVLFNNIVEEPLSILLLY